ncbi:ABC transporter [Aspergillus aculeatinus CBS 121060]|uniref:ABC transporter n=1 Tax=Aspergillus aculeatinus CBS 121060 TaxID=1448322 RepID=A0ACD1H2N3_9EURO|nr:ABC transporter [Aspergillus aculeatinus CBS 121060]RAH67797.1 ABC transporter [Aspergillus aculeatinus CBS 121060]
MAVCVCVCVCVVWGGWMWGVGKAMVDGFMCGCLGLGLESLDSCCGCRGDFDFTLKFEDIVLSILPSAVFIALAIPRAILLTCKSSLAGNVYLRSTKLTAASIYLILRLVLLVLAISEPHSLPNLSITANSLDLVAAISISILTFLEHSRSLRPSILLSAFLSLTILFDIARVRTLWLLAHTHFQHVYALLLALDDHKTRSPEETSGLYGLGTFVWLVPLVISGYKKVLDLSDLYSLDPSVSIEALQKTFAEYTQRALSRKDQNGLTKAVARTLATSLLLPVIPRLALVGFTICQSFLIETMLEWLTKPDTDLTVKEGYALIGATALVYVGMPIITALYWYLHERALFMIRPCLVSAIYQKTTQQPISAGDDKAAVTLMSADVERIMMGLMQLHELWANPLQVAIVSWLLQRQIGTAFVAPLIVVIIGAIMSTVVMRFVGPKQIAWMQAIQKRVGHTSTVIATMKHLRISGLTQPVEDAIRGLRRDELHAGGKFRSFLVTSVGIGFMPVLLSPIFAFAFSLGNLNTTAIFTSLAYLQLLCGPFSTLFQVAPQLLAAFTSLSRIQIFLEGESRHDYRHLLMSDEPWKEKTAGEKLPPVVDITAGGFGWQSNVLTLKNLDVSISAGLNIIYGPVACGKTTLCKALLGEIPFTEGEVFIRTKSRQIGYCEQVPFLPNASIRDAIQGYSTFDAERYTSVVEATMLSRDLQLLSQGDQTQIGSDGIALSGGQKRRIALARTLYLQCDLLILDDVLSGLDTTTEEHILHAVFGPSGILRDRGAVAIFCTSAIRHLSAADYIIALGEDGTIAEKGSPRDLRTLTVQTAAASERGTTPRPSSPPSAPTNQSAPANGYKAVSPKIKSGESSRAIGDAAVFMYYCRSIGPWLLISFATFGVLCGFLYNFPTIWVGYWSTDAFGQSKSFYLGIYACLQCLALATVVSEAAIGMLAIIRTSGSRLHDALLRTVIAAPWSTLSQTDTGVLTNLFSQDMTLIDGELAQALINTSLQVWIAIGGAAVIVAGSSPYTLIAYPFILAIIYAIQRFHLRTSRQLRLLDLEAKSPLYSHHLNTIKGVATLRAFGWVNESIGVNNALLDASQRPAYLLSMIQRWLSFVLDMVVAILAVLVVALTTQLRDTSAGFTGASLVALMSFGKTLAGLVRMYTALETSIGAVARIKAFCDSGAGGAGLEENRLEDDSSKDGDSSTRLPASWPEKGSIAFQHVSASYSNEATPDSDTLAIRDVSFTIEPGQKVAICGRTGSGKSTILLLLLRLLDPIPSPRTTTTTAAVTNADEDTALTIDGVPLHSIDHATLRHRLIAVPQDAIFLPDGTASFRTNLLAPFPNETPDPAECQTILERTGLWSVVTARGGLDAPFTADALSHGQKQLWSLARAVLRRRVRAKGLAEEQCTTEPSGAGFPFGKAMSKTPAVSLGDRDHLPSMHQGASGGILLLDEIDSGVDAATQRVIRNLIWSEFAGYTVVMVGHRLELVGEFDRVLVMDAGRLVEDGAPAELVARPRGWFRDLWMVGRAEA